MIVDGMDKTEVMETLRREFNNEIKPMCERLYERNELRIKLKAQMSEEKHRYTDEKYAMEGWEAMKSSGGQTYYIIVAGTETRLEKTIVTELEWRGRRYYAHLGYEDGVVMVFAKHAVERYIERVEGQTDMDWREIFEEIIIADRHGMMTAVLPSTTTERSIYAAVGDALFVGDFPEDYTDRRNVWFNTCISYNECTRVQTNLLNTLSMLKRQRNELEFNPTMMLSEEELMPAMYRKLDMRSYADRLIRGVEYLKLYGHLLRVEKHYGCNLPKAESERMLELIDRVIGTIDDTVNEDLRRNEGIIQCGEMLSPARLKCDAEAERLLKEGRMERPDFVMEGYKVYLASEMNMGRERAEELVRKINLSKAFLFALTKTPLNYISHRNEPRFMEKLLDYGRILLDNSYDKEAAEMHTGRLRLLENFTMYLFRRTSLGRNAGEGVMGEAMKRVDKLLWIFFDRNPEMKGNFHFVYCGERDAFCELWGAEEPWDAEIRAAARLLAEGEPEPAEALAAGMGRDPKVVVPGLRRELSRLLNNREMTGDATIDRMGILKVRIVTRRGEEFYFVSKIYRMRREGEDCAEVALEYARGYAPEL